jgi:hypothetical protein
MIVVAALTLAEYATGLDLALDQLIVRDDAPVPSDGGTRAHGLQHGRWRSSSPASP